MGAAIKFIRPLGPLQSNCLHDAAKAGDPGAGPMTRDGFGTDFYYVDGTPVMSMLYGVDVVAMERWGKAPDMVLSGINEGRNVGAIVLASGTVSNAQIAMTRGIPAVAFSGGRNTANDGEVTGAESDAVAKLATDLIALLDARAGDGNPVLPAGLGLNVNFPDDITDAKWVSTQIGTFSEVAPRFTTDIGAAVAAEPRISELTGGLQLPALPGLMIELPSARPTAEQMRDEAVVSQRHITVSPMQMGYAAGGSDGQAWVGELLEQPAAD
jgi:5'-nucleotidase